MDNPSPKNKCLAIQFELSIRTFTDILPVILKSNPYSLDTTFSFNLQNDDILKISFIKTIRPKYPDSNIFSNPISTNNNKRVDFVTSIHGTHVFNFSDDLKQL